MKITKRAISLFLSMALIFTMVPAFALFNTETAQAKDVAASDYWTPVASTDFTQTTWTKNGSYNWYTDASPRVKEGVNKVGDYGMGWSVQFRDNEPEVTVDNGVKFWYNSGSDHNQGVMYMSSYNGQTSNSMFSAAANGGTAITSFKIDVKFSLFGQTKANSGYALSERRGENVFFKLCESDTKYGFESRYSYNYVYYAQESYGRRHMKNNSDIYAASGVQDGGNYVLSTDKSYISADTDYHYVMYVADGWLCSYITDEAGNVAISYDPIDVSNYTLSPSDITGLFLNGSEFNVFGYEDFENVRYKSIIIYKGAENATLDNSKSKYLYTYFTGNSTNGESLHYAVSDDGIDFKPVNNGLPVWDSTASWSITQYPTGSTSGTATSKHVRDPYILNKRNTSTGAVTSGYYILATDLNTQNGSNWGNNSKLLVYDVANLQNIDTTTPWVIDTTDMCSSLTGGSVSRAWAPQAIWDNVEGKYMLYWSVGYIGGLTKLYYIYTSDFKTFEGTPKQLLYPTGFNSFIDADITYHNGIYYCFFKDEDNKKIYRAIAPRPNGPYQGFTKFSDTGMEGPQVYECIDGSYALMTDEYGSGDYHIYRASTPRNLNESEVATSNINYLSPRHGSVIRITPAEYNAIVSKFGTLTPNTVEYYWANDRSWGNNEEQGTVMKDTAGHDFVSAWWSGGATVGGNKITLNNGRIYSADSQMCNYLNGDAYTVDFTYKSAGTNQDDTHIIAAITKGSNGTAYDHTYIAITASGKFFVNGEEAMYTNAATLTSAATDTSNSHRYRITFNGHATCLLVDNTYVGGAIDTVDKVDSLWLTFGFGRGNLDGTNSIDTNIAGEYGKVTISPTATDIGETAEEALLDTIRPDRADLVDANNNLVFNVQPYHKNDGIASAAYKNVVYSPENTTSWSGNGSSDTYAGVGRINFKVAMPLNTVLVYDGVSANNPVAPIMVETKCNDTGGSAHKIYYAEIKSSTCFTLTQQWNGYTGGDGGDSNSWLYWVANRTLSATDKFSYSSSVSNTSSDSQRDSTSRFWWNKLVFNSNYFTTNSDKYYVADKNISFNAKTSYNSWGTQEKTGYFTSLSNNYVLNYKPVYDILKSGTTATKSTNAGNKTALELYDYLLDEDGEAQWMYTTESRIGALMALKKLADCNPKNYNYGEANASFTYKNTNYTGVEAVVTRCAHDIEAAKAAWDAINLEKKPFTINYDKYGTDSDTSVTLTAGETLTTSPAAIPANTNPSHINNSNYHWTYSWTSSTGVWDDTQTPSASHVPHSNETYIETRDSNAVHCAYSDEVNILQGWTHHNGETADDNGYSTSYCNQCHRGEKVWDKHDTEWATYDDYVNRVEEGGAYTTTSREIYETQIASTISGVTEFDETKSKTFIDNKNSALATAAATYLNPLAEYILISEAINARATDLSSTTATYNSWKNLVDKCDEGQALIDDNAASSADQGKYTVGAGNVVNSGLDGTGTTEEKSSYQNAIEAKQTAINGATLTQASNDTRYESLESARAVVSAINRDKYISTALTTFDNAVSTAYAGAYHTLTPAEATTYNSYTDGGYAAGEKIKNSGNVDSITASILSAASTLDTPANTKKFTGTVQVTDSNGTAIEGYTTPVALTNSARSGGTDFYYGDTYEIPIPAVAQGKCTISITSKDPYSATPEAAVGSQKVNCNGSSFAKKAVNNIEVIIKVNQKDAAAANQTKVDIKNIYGSTVDTFYVATDDLNAMLATDWSGSATLNFTSATATAPAVPFYTFSYWYVVRGSGTAVFRPVYTAGEAITLTINGAIENGVTGASYDSSSGTYKAALDNYVTITGSDIYGWATYANDKYQIAAYGDTISLYAVTDETFYPITKSGDDYYANGAKLTADNVDVKFTVTEVSADSLLNQKLTAKKPFVSVIDISTVTNGNNKYSSATGYGRVTTGTGVQPYSEIGFLATSRAANITDTNMVKPTVQAFKVTSVLPTGQYTYTLSTNGSGFATIGFRGYIAYDLDYSAAGETATLNVDEYSSTFIQKPTA